MENTPIPTPRGQRGPGEWTRGHEVWPPLPPHLRIFSPLLALGLSLICMKEPAGFPSVELSPHSSQVKQGLSPFPDDDSEVHKGSGTWPYKSGQTQTQVS